MRPMKSSTKQVLTKKYLIKKLNEYLQNRITRDELSDWAMTVEAEDYECEADVDSSDFKMMNDIIFGLVESDVKEFTPSKEEVEYLIRCLEGKAKYEAPKLSVQK